ncbi:MAG: type IIL restriction-modification enzyme MmeI, partial [Lentihominibacter sp.]
ESRKKPICMVPEIVKGSSPVDGGNLFVSKEEYEQIIHENPVLNKYIKKFLGAKEFLHNLERRCLWLEGITPAELKSSPTIMNKIALTKEFRLSSTKVATQKYAEYPMRFMEMRQPDSTYILVPRHTSENRRYIPFGFMDHDVICGDANNMIPNSKLYHFGVIISNVHMAWVRAVCGRLKSDYRYSNDIVYNNFPWPSLSDENVSKIEKTAQAILDARALYPESSLADLYDPLLMPIELRKAHQANDRAVMQAYGFNIKEMSEADCVAELMKLYQELTKQR